MIHAHTGTDRLCKEDFRLCGKNNEETTLNIWQLQDNDVNRKGRGINNQRALAVMLASLCAHENGTQAVPRQPVYFASFHVLFDWLPKLQKGIAGCEHDFWFDDQRFYHVSLTFVNLSQTAQTWISGCLHMTSR